MDVMRKHGYELGIFASSPIYRLVELDRTVFANVPNLRTETAGEGSVARDRALTADWMRWLDRRDASHPFFGFLYYNAAVAVEPPADYRPPIPPPASRPAKTRSCPIPTSPARPCSIRSARATCPCACGSPSAWPWPASTATSTTS